MSHIGASMSDTQRALDAGLELLHRFDAAVEDGLLADLRIRRRRRAPWERDDQASVDLRRIGALVRAVHLAADELVDIAARYDQERERAILSARSSGDHA